MAWRIAEQLPGGEWLMPKHGKDWNEWLMHPENSNSSPFPANNAVIKQLWQWHRTVKRLGRPDAYLSDITGVAQDVVKEANLSDRASVAMTRDMAYLLQWRVTSRHQRTTIEVER